MVTLIGKVNRSIYTSFGFTKYRWEFKCRRFPNVPGAILVIIGSWTVRRQRWDVILIENKIIIFFWKWKTSFIQKDPHVNRGKCGGGKIGILFNIFQVFFFIYEFLNNYNEYKTKIFIGISIF